MFLTVVAMVVGVVALATAADQFVLGAARVAQLRGVAPIVVGVLVIGFGTSAPELLVSVLAAVGDEPDVAFGNVVGSNLANLTLLLGVGAILVPLVVDSRTVAREVPIAIAAMAALTVAVQGGGIEVWEGAALTALMVVVVLVVLRRAGADATDALGRETEELTDPATHRLGVEVVRTVLGLLGTIGGAQALLWGATDLADRAGLSAGFVGATIVAIGTSLPELVTVVQSARRRETDLIVGNLIGSNLFNSLVVGGAIGLAGGDGITGAGLTVIAAGAALGAAVVAGIMMWTGRTITRREGVVLVLAYVATVPFLS